MSKESLLDPKMDFIFKRIFGSENDTDILIRFLNAIFEAKHTDGEYDPIVEVKILNTEITKESIEDKESILDIRAKTSKGELLNIEIQRKDEGNLLKRGIYYLCKIVTEQLESGDDYNQINRAVAIVITDFKTKFVENNDFHNTYNLLNNVHKTMLTDLMELHFIELPKMEILDEDDVLQLFLQFLINPNDEIVEEKSSKIEELSKAKQKLTRLSRDPKTRIEFEAREKALKDKTSSLNHAREEGREEVRAEADAKVKKAEAKAKKAQAKIKDAEAKEKKAETKAKKAQAKIKDAEAKEKKAETKAKKAQAELANSKLESAKSLLDILDDVTIANRLGLDVSQVAKLREE